jgi:hypothetical protein
VEELRQSMSQAEFIQWIEFYKLNPFDDYHRFHRPAVLIAASNGADMKRSIEWLQPDPAYDGFSDADMNTFKALGITPNKE